MRPPEAKPGERVARAFGDTVARLHDRSGGDPAAGAIVGQWARGAWRDAESGHVCVDVPGEAQRRALASSPVVDVAPGAGEAPLVLDGDALYLQRLWRAEERLAECIGALDAPAAPRDAALVAATVDSLFAPAEADDAQRHALLRALGHRLTLLSGGPGTGKTTTLARLLVAFARLAPDARVAFAAPTGKAAARLGQSLSEQLVRFDPTGELRARLPGAGTTVHRLLGLRGAGAAPAAAATAAMPLDFDLVLVDEASMLDVELAAALVAAIGANARLVLAGDRDQLASVEAGAVFADLCASVPAATVQLSRNHRQKDAAHIVEIAAQVRDADGARVAGQADDARALPLRWPGPIGRHRPDPAAIVADALAAWAEVREAIDARAPPAAVLVACERHRVLTAMRDGPLGSVALNRRIASAVRSGTRTASSVAQWYAGRLVLVTANRPALGLFNGDVGVCLPHPDARGDARDALVVAFFGASELRLLPVAQVPPCEDAWAMTVHKAQGSEFESVALVLAPPGHALNTRELVYTGITRARSRLAIWAEPEVVAQAALSRSARRGRLVQRLAARRGTAAAAR
ncbi:MAG: exodeoxyribonuclease V subunit alpha [Burkholderiaceae bacterium]|nr:exodeoxyribonuclease V subunit alpha [Burkholderiaceae bacterium]